MISNFSPSSQRFSWRSWPAWRETIFALVSAAFTLAAAAAEPTPPAAGDDEELLQELMQVVEQGTEIATRTRMNVDYVPGMATVLESDLLQALGARTVGDAVALVPGVLAFRGNGGEPFMTVRGVPFPFNSGNVKLMVNGIAMSGESAGINNSVLLLPLEQVERIEFVRGPGSTLYGDFAFMGLLNIVTRQDGSRVFVRPQENSLTGGGQLGWRSADAGTRLSLSASALGADDAEVPGDGEPEDRQRYAVLGLEHGGFGFNAQSTRRTLSPPTGTDFSEQNDALSARQRVRLSPTLEGEGQVFWLANDFENPQTRFDGQQWIGQGELRWSAGAGHALLARLSYTQEQIDEARQSVPAPPPPAPPPPPAQTLRDVEREYWGIGVQDQWTLRDDLTLTLGLRYDRRDDLDEQRLTPRIAGVWHVAEAHILKAQYAEGYRAPTFFELYGPTGKTDVDLETVGTTELSYIFRKPQRTGRLTLFHSRLDDMIFNRGMGFTNTDEGRSRGVEAEWQQQLNPALQWQTNLSYVDSATTRGLSSDEDDERLAPEWLANVALIYRPSSRWLLGTHYTHVAAREAAGIGDENRLALSVSAVNLFTRGLTLRLYARNVLGQEEYTAFEMPNETIAVRTFDERIAGAQLSYEF